MANVTDGNNDGDLYNDEEFDTSCPPLERTAGRRFQYRNRQTITVAVPLLKSPDDDDGDDQRKTVDTAAVAGGGGGGFASSNGIIETPPRSTNHGSLNNGTVLSLDDFMQVSSPAVSELLASMQDKLDEKEETIRQLQEDLNKLRRFSSSEMSTNSAAGGLEGELFEQIRHRRRTRKDLRRPSLPEIIHDALDSPRMTINEILDVVYDPVYDDPILAGPEPYILNAENGILLAQQQRYKTEDAHEEDGTADHDEEQRHRLAPRLLGIVGGTHDASIGHGECDNPSETGPHPPFDDLAPLGSSQSSSQCQSQSQIESPSSKRRENGHKNHHKHKKLRSKKNKNRAETQRAAIDSFMTTVKGKGKSSAENWQRLVQSMKAKNRKEKLHVALSNGRKDTKEAGGTDNLIEDVPVPETDQKEGVVTKRSVISSQKSVKWKDDIEDSTSYFDDEERNHKRDMFAQTQTPSTTLLINNMKNLSEEDVWEDEDDDDYDDYDYNNIEYDNLPAASYNLESDTTTEKSVDPREAFSKMQSPSTALLIDRMEQLSEELLVEVDHWEGTLSFSDDDEGDVDDDIGNAAPLYEKKGSDMQSDRRRSQRSTILLLKRMEELNEELAVEMDNLNDHDDDGMATKSSAEEAVRATGNAKTSSHSSRMPLSTCVLVDGMENLGGLLSVEHMEDGGFE